MKKITILFTLMFLIVGMISFAAAEETATPTLYGEDAPTTPETISEDVEIELEDAGSVPGDFFYGFDKGFDNLGLALTFNDERKIEKSLRIAEERLAEAEELSKRGEFEKAEIVQESYDKFLEKAERSFFSFAVRDEKSLKKIEALEEKINSHEKKILNVKVKVFEKLNDNLTYEQSIKINKIFERFEDAIRGARNNVLENKIKKEAVYREFSKMTNKEINAALEEIRNDSIIELKNRKDIKEIDKKLYEKEMEAIRLENLLTKESLSQENISRIEKNIITIRAEMSELGTQREEKINKNFTQEFTEIEKINQEDLEERRKLIESVLEAGNNDKQIEESRRNIAAIRKSIGELDPLIYGTELKEIYDLLNLARYALLENNTELSEEHIAKSLELIKKL